MSRVYSDPGSYDDIDMAGEREELRLSRERYEKRSRRKKTMGMFAKAGLIVGGILLVVSLLGLVAFCVISITDRDYHYNAEIHSHMENAYYSADPDTMREEILLAKAGMQNAGLKPEMYDAFWPWQKTPDRQMSWQYKHMDSILTRIDEFRVWETAQGSIGSSQQMKDVYTEKLDNVRNFIKDDGGWSDWIALGAFSLNNYFWLVVLLLGSLALFIFSAIMIVLGYIFLDA